jgi:predicted dehydrogenase
MEKVKAGIIGLGFMSVAHVKAYRKLEDVEIVAVCNPSGRRLDGDLSDVFGNVGDQEPVKLDMEKIKGYQDVDAFLKHPGLQLVDICSPTDTHTDLAIRALNAGKHVLCEKPITRTSEEAARLVEAVKASETHFMPAMCLRFWPEWTFLKKAIEDQTYGKVLGVRFRRIAEPPGWSPQNYLDGKKSGGALLDLHIHDTDFVQFCFGVPKAVFSTGFTKVSGETDHVVTQYLTESGACVSAEGSWAMTAGFGFNMAYNAVFERVTIDYDIVRGDEALKVFEEGKEARVVTMDGLDGYAGEIQHLVDCIRENKRPSVVTPEDGLNAIRICEAEARSVSSRQVEPV